VIFDLDLTLIETRLQDAFDQFAAAHPSLGGGRDLYLASKGRTLSNFVTHIWPDCPAPVEAVEELGLLQMQCTATPLPGARALLASLPRSRWGIFTSAERRRALPALEQTRLPQPHVLICSEDVPLGKGKPQPDGLLLAASGLRVERKHCVYVGDARADMEAALNAEMPFIGVGPDPEMQDAHLWVETLARLSIEELSDGWLRVRQR
jgi:HAD superfamily hydrolase (TIGR01509 family)